MKNTILIILLSFITYSNCAYSQKLDSVISKEKMYADFDSLISTVSNANPHLEIYKKTIGIDVIKEMKKRRACIDTINSLTSYYIHLAITLRMIPEGHVRLLKSREINKADNWYKKQYPNYFDTTTIYNYKKIDEGFFAYYGKIEGQKWEVMRSYEIPLTYINGEFYVLRPIEVKNKENDEIIKINSGDKLLKINNYTVDSFINCHNDKFTYAAHVNKWDYKNKKFYNEQLLKNNYLFDKDVSLEFYDNNLASTKTVKYIGGNILKNYKSNNTLGSYNSFKPKQDKVLYFDSTLYVKITAMNLDRLKYLQDEIIKYKDSIISKVIIDVRNNGGGSDYFWEGILSSISDTKLCRHQRLGIRNWSKLNTMINSNVDSLQPFYDTLLNEDFKLLADDNECHEIIPDSNSINYSGKIYLLHNRNSFSSATAFVTFALGSDKIIAVGESNGYLGGYGTNPFLFQLPYSKIMFVMHSTIHIPINANNANDYYWNKTEVEVNTTPYFESLMYEYSEKDIFTETFLKNQDLYFKKVLEITN